MNRGQAPLGFVALAGSTPIRWIRTPCWSVQTSGGCSARSAAGRASPARPPCPGERRPPSAAGRRVGRRRRAKTLARGRPCRGDRRGRRRGHGVAAGVGATRPRRPRWSGWIARAVVEVAGLRTVSAAVGRQTTPAPELEVDACALVQAPAGGGPPPGPMSASNGLGLASISVVLMPRAVAAEATSWPISPAPTIATCSRGASARRAGARRRACAGCGALLEAGERRSAGRRSRSAGGRTASVVAGSSSTRASCSRTSRVVGPQLDVGRRATRRELAAALAGEDRPSRAAGGRTARAARRRTCAIGPSWPFARSASAQRWAARPGADEDDPHAVAPFIAGACAAPASSCGRRTTSSAAAGTAVASMNARNQDEPASVPAPSVWIRPST